MCCSEFKCRLGLTLGVFAAIVHAIWAILVASGVGQKLLGWKFSMHFLNSTLTVTEVSWGYAILLVVLAFVGAFIVGWVLGLFWELFSPKEA